MVSSTQSAIFIVLALSGLVPVGLGTSSALEQRNALAHVHAVPAKVVGFDIEEHRPNGNHAVTYRPVVHFEYQVDGTTRMGDHVGPLREFRGGHWAWQVLYRYEVGQHDTAWVREDVLDQAYLERVASPRPYYAIAAGVVFIAFICWAWRRVGLTSGVLESHIRQS